MQWLEADLQATRADWIIAYRHHPPYSKGSHDSDFELELIQMRFNAVQMLERDGADLVLSGHSHNYERSKLINGHYSFSFLYDDDRHAVDAGSGRDDETGAYRKPGPGVEHAGTVYVVAGSSGKTGGGPLNHPAMYISLDQLGSLVIDIEALTLNAKFLDASGAVRDSFTIQKDLGF
jgi:acid phosphatase type 7